MITRVTELETAIAAAASSAVVRWRSPAKGVLTRMWLSALDPDVAARAGLEISFYRRRRFVTTGNEDMEAFEPQLADGGANDAGPEMQTLLWPLDDHEEVLIQIHNAGAAPVTPRLLFEIVGVDDAVP